MFYVGESRDLGQATVGTNHVGVTRVNFELCIDQCVYDGVLADMCEPYLGSGYIDWTGHERAWFWIEGK